MWSNLPEGLLSALTGKARPDGYSDPYVNNVGLFVSNSPKVKTPESTAMQGLFNEYLPERYRQQSSGGGYQRSEPSEWSQMSPSQQAAWYAENPTMAKITQMGQGLWSFLDPWGLASAQEKYFPAFTAQEKAIASGQNPTDPATYGYDAAQEAVAYQNSSDAAAQAAMTNAYFNSIGLGDSTVSTPDSDAIARAIMGGYSAPTGMDNDRSGGDYGPPSSAAMS